MRITKITGIHISIPLSVPYKLSRVYGTVSDAHAVVVRVETNGGLVGYGEADPHPPFTADTVPGTLEAIRDHLAPSLLGANACEINRLEGEMDACLDGHLMAKGALDMALFDLTGKSHGSPVHALLGGKVRDEILLSFPLGSGTAAEDMQVIEERRKTGFRSFMAKMGRNTIDAEIARVANLSDRYANEIHLVADANQGWTRDEGEAFVKGARGSMLELVEQPVAADDVEGLKRIREKSSIAISADESVVTEEDALRLACMDAVDVFSVKASKNGGLTKARRIVAIADAAGLQYRMNSMLEFGITQAALLQLGAVSKALIPSGHAYMSTLRMADDFTDFCDRLGDGYARITDTPGLGVTVHEEKLSQYAVESFVVQ